MKTQKWNDIIYANSGENFGNAHLDLLVFILCIPKDGSNFNALQRGFS